MDLLLFSLGSVGFIAALVFLIISFIRKKPKKRPLIALGICFALAVTGLFMDGKNYNEEEPEEVADVETDDEDEEKEEKTTDEEEAVRDPEKMKEHLSGSIGEGEEITEIKIDGNDIFITVDLGDNSDKDLACSRYSSITDKLLEDEFWNDITIEFVGVGKLTMNSSQAKTNEFGGKYFDSLYIYENLE